MLGAPGGRRGAQGQGVEDVRGDDGAVQQVHIGDMLQVSLLPKILSRA